MFEGIWGEGRGSQILRPPPKAPLPTPFKGLGEEV